MPLARLARLDDLPSLLTLFEALREISQVSALAEPRERAESIWQKTIAQPGVYVFVSDDHNRIAATCMLVVAPNLLQEEETTGSSKTWSPIPTCKVEVTARPLFKPR
jgi:hypothetical protein